MASLADNDFNRSKIPSEISNLFRLSYLDLMCSNFFGQIPWEILELSKLETLDTSLNHKMELQKPGLRSLVEKLTHLKVLILDEVNISSPVPRILANFSSLTVLSLMGCELHGEFPAKIFRLPNLHIIDVEGNENLSGYLPEFEKSSPLQALILEGTRFFGEIPHSMGNLRSLVGLCIRKCAFSGSIPSSLGNLSSLDRLALGSNRFTGPIPFEIRNLAQLSFLDLGSNQLQGPFPSAFYDFKNLQWLDVGSNNLSGKVDLDMLLHKLKSLQVLILSSNNLSLLTKTNVHTKFSKLYILRLGSCNLIEFPDFLQNQDQLSDLDLSSNKIVAPIPRWFFSFNTINLGFVNLSNNLLTGFDQGPISLSRTGIVSLDLRSNKLQGSLPIPSLHTMVYLVSYNNFTGEIPLSICNLNSLQVLDLSHNNLSGKLPQCLATFSHLSTLNLQSNKFHGSIPQNLLNGTNLRMIDLSQNQLQRRIPRSLVNCTKLEFLNLGNNQIRDTFPSWLETLPKLKVLILQSNRLRGAIKEPETNYSFPKLRIIDLSHNKFIGYLPSKFFQFWNAMKVVNASPLAYLGTEMLFKSSGNIVHVSMNYGYSFQMRVKGIELDYGKISNFLTAISFSGNKFEGEIPTSITNLRGLRFLNLSNNNLKGPIPAAMGNLTALESLDVSNNKLSGQIPQQLEDLTFLAFFNVSNNHLTGRIPQGKQFDTFENISFDGNPGLCGKQIARKCEDFQPPKKEEGPAGLKFPSEFGWKIILIGFASGLVTGVALEHAYSARKKAHKKRM
ncbi:receptor-like protein 6 [Pistacia vera]|uniref:receptor-like protein 6 n=1 Tax=Pistacia vera TaxID=55513 RepID=UPI001263A940|nr:receptor-like protein 6 [Pistacia vera]